MIDDELLEEELLLVRDSGELPEVALHSAFYWLERDTEGPRLVLTACARRRLVAAAAARWEEIILRDMTAANRTLPLWRGLPRALVNLERFTGFCTRWNWPQQSVYRHAAEALARYLAVLAEEGTAVDCPPDDFARLVAMLGVATTASGADTARRAIDRRQKMSYNKDGDDVRERFCGQT